MEIYHSFYLKIILKNNRIHLLYPMNGNYNILYYNMINLNDNSNKSFRNLKKALENKENISISPNKEFIQVNFKYNKTEFNLNLEKQEEITPELEELLKEINEQEYSEIQLKMIQNTW